MNNILIVLTVALLACQTLAVFVNGIAGKNNSYLGARIASSLVGSGFVAGIMLLYFTVISGVSINALLVNFNKLGLVLCSLILFVSFIVHRFSIRYMDGDKLYNRYFFTLSAVTCTAIVMVIADNLYLFWFAWSLSNLLLILLMVHKSEWSAAKSSGLLTLKILVPGSLSLLTAMILISLSTDTVSISILSHHSRQSSTLVSFIAMGLIAFTALTQSALWPFHRWLTSSLNSPTPVSALMHAGLVNGGGILIVKFASLFAVQQGLLMVLFVLGAISAILGTVWKLMQSDIKRMLACSTMAQMGFMMMQCGLGLFAAAIAHLCWHGLFKAYLFLSSGSAITQKRDINIRESAKPLPFVLSIAGGLLAMMTFAYSTNKPILSLQVTSFLLSFAFIAGAQLTLTIIDNKLHFKKLVTGVIISSIYGFIYGSSIHAIETLIPNLTMLYGHKLNVIHGVTLFIFVSIWALFNLGVLKKVRDTNAWCWLYMTLINASQPSKKTITTLRTSYYY
ncbi:MAG: proton-conducting transporter membrane subunit [Legionellaceae bacterium]|nr:proton-conducting transporter membrane subunit [Legionellaceae bacterium]